MATAGMTGANLIDKLYRGLLPQGRSGLEMAIGIADEMGLPFYLAGGSVRDLLLGRPLLDLDLVCQGDAPSLALRIARALGARCVVHAAFATATVSAPTFAFDIASARSETYPRPGALPRVQPAGLVEDLARRDFTINAMALALNGPDRGRLLDPHGGRQDLERGLIRVLHDGSFVDDATRILRALRYEARLGFRIEEHTLDLLRRQVGYLETISGARLRRELMLILQEDEPERALLRAQALGALAAIHSALTFDDGLAEAFALARRQALPERPLVYLALLARRWSEGDAAAVARRLALSKRQRQASEAMPQLRSLAGQLTAAGLRPSQVVETLSPFPTASLWAFALAADDLLARWRARLYLKEWRYVKPTLDGQALLALGVPAGPQLGEVLRRLRAAKLDGQVHSRDEEIAFVKSALAGQMAGDHD